jgi:two-component system sensor histidine kinase KdpD
MQLPAAYNRIPGYVLSLLLVSGVSGALFGIRAVLDTTLITLILLIPVGVCTAAFGLGPGISAAVLAFLGINYLFIQPYYTLSVHRAGDLAILVAFLIVAVVISQLVGQARSGVEAATAREREATRLYELSTALSGIRESSKIARTLGEQLSITMRSECLVIRVASPNAAEVHFPEDLAAPGRKADFRAPMGAVRGEVGEIYMWRARPPISPAERRLVQIFASQGALALESAALAQAESRAKILEESDRFKSSLLSSVSHDLRTPLATIKAAASSLRSGEIEWQSAARVELVAAIDDEADHLNLLVGNLLDMSRIESGALQPQRRWNVLSEIVQSVATRMRHASEGHGLLVEIPDDLPLIPVDFVLMGQVFTNLLTNSLKFAPAGTPVRILARVRDDTSLQVQVSNQGPPVPAEHLQGIFDRFYRMTAADRVTGTGLGLSICKGIIEAHDGTIWAENLADGFAFNFTLPLRMDATHKTHQPGKAAPA